eukprot:COSAG04_NODE_91_length_26852_cov_8.609315_4_plen_125_part_00
MRRCAQVAGVQEGDVLAELQGVTIEGAESFAAAQQLVKSAAMGSVVSWVFQAHAEEEVSALLEEEEEEEQPVLDLVRQTSTSQPLSRHLNSLLRAVVITSFVVVRRWHLSSVKHSAVAEPSIRG